MNKLIPTIALLFILSTANAKQCGKAEYHISQIQGSEEVSPYLGKTVNVEGVVVGDFQGPDALSGFFLQSFRKNKDPEKSSGIFIHHSKQDVQLGDYVFVEGKVSERNGLTQIYGLSKMKICAKNQPLPKPKKIKLPLDEQGLEHLEGMFVTVDESTTVTDMYQFLKYGEFTVSKDLLFTPTQIAMPGKVANIQKNLNHRNKLLIDDGSNRSFIPQTVTTVKGTYPFSARNPICLGSKVEISGVLDFNHNRFRIQPTRPPLFKSNEKIHQLKPKDIDGDLKIATFNLENWFTTIDNGKEICGPLENFLCRGADSKTEQHRQLTKLVAAINRSGAELIALQELENNQDQSIKQLVQALNRQSRQHQWQYIDTGVMGTDTIKVGMIYQPKAVTPLGDFIVFDQQTDPKFRTDRHRPVLLQTFVSKYQGTRFNFSSIHLKSKSCKDATAENQDQKDGQSCYAHARLQAVKHITAWLAQDPTGQKAKINIMAGDFNSYGKEDAMRYLKNLHFQDLADKFLTDYNWSSAYRGEVGALDHILVNKDGIEHAKGATQWHINSTEHHGFDYNVEDLEEVIGKPDGFYQKGPFASSDHDIIIAGFDF